MHLKENIKKKETVVIGDVYREMWRQRVLASVENMMLRDQYDKIDVGDDGRTDKQRRTRDKKGGREENDTENCWRRERHVEVSFLLVLRFKRCGKA